MGFYKVKVSLAYLKQLIPERYYDRVAIMQFQGDKDYSYVATNERVVITTIMHYPEFEQLKSSPFNKNSGKYNSLGSMDLFS